MDGPAQRVGRAQLTNGIAGSVTVLTIIQFARPKPGNIEMSPGRYAPRKQDTC